MKEESKKWLEQIIKENKESDNPLKYTMCSFEILEYLNNLENNWKELK